jgi:hypothetical protein
VVVEAAAAKKVACLGNVTIYQELGHMLVAKIA